MAKKEKQHIKNHDRSNKRKWPWRQKEKKIGTQKPRKKRQDFIILVDTRLKTNTMKEINNEWKGFNFGTINATPDSSGGILILARKDMDMIPITTGEDTEKKGRVAW